jgi:trans-2-enoyl-CoA reductase
MAMAGLLGSDAHLVTYGAMAKRPIPIPASLYIFKNLTSHGFWLSRWYKDNGERQIKLVEELARIMASGKVSSCLPLNERNLCHIFDQFKEPKHEIVTIEKETSEEQASIAISEVFQRIALGSFKKKVVLRVRGDDQ